MFAQQAEQRQRQVPENQRIQIPHVPPWQQQGGQHTAALGKILPQNDCAKEKHQTLPKEIEPKLLGDQLARVEPRHQTAAGTEQRHVEGIDAEKGRTDERIVHPVLLHKVAEHHQQDAKTLQLVNVIAAGGHQRPSHGERTTSPESTLAYSATSAPALTMPPGATCTPRPSAAS